MRCSRYSSTELSLALVAAAGFLFRACAANVVSDVLAAEGVQVLSVGPELQPFDRRLPETVEATLLKRFEGSLNKTQVCSMGIHACSPSWAESSCSTAPTVMLLLLPDFEFS